MKQKAIAPSGGCAEVQDKVDSAHIFRILEKYNENRGGLISVLEEIQAEYGYLPEEALRIVSDRTQRSLVDVYGVATFYRSFSLKPRGKHLVCACQGTACHVRGAPKIVEELEHQLERRPLVEEIAKHVDKEPHEVAHTMQISWRHQSLDTPFSDLESNSLMDIIPDPESQEPDDNLFDDSLKEDIRLALSTLKDRERAVLKMYFGIDQSHALTLNEIGEKFNLTRERVRQIKEKAIHRLQHTSRSPHLRPYI